MSGVAPSALVPIDGEISPYYMGDGSITDKDQTMVKTVKISIPCIGPSSKFQHPPQDYLIKPKPYGLLELHGSMEEREKKFYAIVMISLLILGTLAISSVLIYKFI